MATLRCGRGCRGGVSGPSWKGLEIGWRSRRFQRERSLDVKTAEAPRRRGVAEAAGAVSLEVRGPSWKGLEIGVEEPEATR